jgi:hypothetical protein
MGFKEIYSKDNLSKLLKFSQNTPIVKKNLKNILLWDNLSRILGFVRENLVENLNTIFSQHEWFSQK